MLSGMAISSIPARAAAFQQPFHMRQAAGAEKRRLGGIGAA
jgi:hypothetical protein